MRQLVASLILAWTILLPPLLSPLGAQEEAIEEAITELPPVTVFGQRLLDQAERPETFTVITREDIAGTSAKNVGDVLWREPGLYLPKKTFGYWGLGTSGAGQMLIRGVGNIPNTGVLILVDGRPEFNGMFGHPTPDTYGVDRTESIKVIKGPASVLYGSNALGGAVLVETRVPERGSHLALDVSGGSFSTSDSLLQVSGRNDTFYALLTGRYRNTEGDRDNSDFESGNYSLKLGWDISPNFTATMGGVYDKFIFEEPGPVGGEPGVGGSVRRETFDFSLDNKFDQFDGFFKFYTAFGKNELEDGWAGKDDEIGILWRENMAFLPGNVLTLGFDWNRFGGHGVRIGPSAVDYGTVHMNQVAPYAAIEQELHPQLIVSGGVRTTFHSEFGDVTTPEVGVVYKALDTTALRIRVARGFRAPTIREMFFFPAPNPDLLPEEMTQYECGVNHRIAPWATVDGEFFYQEGKNRIRTFYDPAIGGMRLDNSGRFFHSGTELQASISPFEGVEFSTFYTYIHFSEQEDQLFVPQHRAGFSAGYAAGPLGVNLFAEYATRLFGNATVEGRSVEVRLPDYFLLNAKFTYRLTSNATAYVEIDNLTDEDYENLPGFPLPGISALAGVSMVF